MGTKLILQGIVQGVFCRNYCSKYGKRLKIQGTASNLPDGTVQVLLNSNDEKLIKEYLYNIKNNPLGMTFYGRIDDITVSDYQGPMFGDYIF